jgi:AraC-like DNA-binding protein
MLNSFSAPPAVCARRFDMLYQAYVPVPPLRDFVEYLWILSDAPPHKREVIVPSGTLELVINLRDDEIRIYDGARPAVSERFTGTVVSGAYGRCFGIDTAEHALVMGAHFRPGGAFPFLGMPADELADAHVDLATLWGRRAGRLRERLCAATAHAERFRLLERALLRRAQLPSRSRSAVRAAAALLARPGAKVSATATQLGMSHRRLIEIFSAEVGMTPKLFNRVRRFQRVLAAATCGAPPDWAQLAIRFNYFDQSHLILDFSAFSGFTPADYVRHRSRRVKENHMALPETA